MRQIFSLVLVVLALVVGGCESDYDSDSKTAMDACPKCAGVQTATADGKCPMCDAKADVMTTSAIADTCPKCAGVQTATADGKCPMCNAKADVMTK